MKKHICILALLLAILTGCAGSGQQSTTPTPTPEVKETEKVSQYYRIGKLTLPEAVPAQTAETCDGFGELTWGDGSAALFEENLANYAVREGAEYAGFTGTAYYTFRGDKFNHWQIIFYEPKETSDIDIFVEVQKYLIEHYGEPSAEPEMSLESAVANSLVCAVIWLVKTDGGEDVKIELRFDGLRERAPRESRVQLTLWYGGQ